ncbi:MAG TPA: hypothetical protein VIJ09_03905 [Acidimicrobiales bacterium]|jgi:hypothetical protein
MGDDESGDGDLPAGSIPSVVLAALRDRMHTRRLSAPEDPGYIQVSLGEEPAAVHVVDDGTENCMIGRPVGRTPDGSVYVLVARISAYGYEQLRDGDMAVTDIWSDSSDTSLMAVYEVDGFVENIALVRHFRHPDDIPAAYRPPSPFIEFSDKDFPDDEVVRSRFFHEAFTKATDVVRRVLPRGPRTPGPPV